MQCNAHGQKYEMAEKKELEVGNPPLNQLEKLEAAKAA